MDIKIYNELKDKLAQGFNSPLNSVVFSVGISNHEGGFDVTSSINGNSILVVPMLKELILNALEDFDDEHARYARDYLHAALIEDERNRGSVL